MAHKIHPGQPHDWLWLGPDVRRMPDGTFKDVNVRVCMICLHDSAPVKLSYLPKGCRPWKVTAGRAVDSTCT